MKSKMDVKIVTLLLGMGAFLMMSFQNCSSNLSSQNANLASGGTSDGLDTNQPNQKPMVNCRLTSDMDADAWLEVSSASDLFLAGTERFDESDNLKIDCSNTSDETTTDQLVFEIDHDYNPTSPNFQAMTQSTQLASTLNGGDMNMAIRVTDAQGESSVQTFTLEVECDASAPSPALAIGGSLNNLISISTGTAIGQFNYSVNTDLIVGDPDGSGFEYSWDFNGDGVFDPYSYSGNGDGASTSELYRTNPNINNVYVNARNQRTIRLRVKNSCNKETIFALSESIPDTLTTLPLSAADDSAATNCYLLGEVRDNQNSSDAVELIRKNYDYQATDAQGFLAFDTNYRNSSLDFNTTKKYRAPDYTVHGMSMELRDVADSGDATGQVQSFSSSNNTVRMSSLTYRVAGEGDGLMTRTYALNSSCSVDMRLIRLEQVGQPCSTGNQPNEIRTEEIYWGEFSCPSLTAGTGDTVRVENGKFYCADHSVDRCNGGGGGGGGINPIPF